MRTTGARDRRRIAAHRTWRGVGCVVGRMRVCGTGWRDCHGVKLIRWVERGGSGWVFSGLRGRCTKGGDPVGNIRDLAGLLTDLRPHSPNSGTTSSNCIKAYTFGEDRRCSRVHTAIASLAIPNLTSWETVPGGCWDPSSKTWDHQIDRMTFQCVESASWNEFGQFRLGDA